MHRTSTQYVRGVGGSTNTRVDMVDLPWIEVAGVRCHKVSGLLVMLSSLSSDIACRNLVQ